MLATGQEMSKALQAGEVQVIGSAFSNYPVAVERGMAAKGVVGMMGDRTGRYSDEPISVWTRKGSGVTKVEDLGVRAVTAPVIDKWSGPRDLWLKQDTIRHDAARVATALLRLVDERRPRLRALP